MLGIHQSFQNPMSFTVREAYNIGADTFQMFIRNNRNGSRRHITAGEIQSFNEALAVYGIKKYVIHAAYCMNLCTDDSYRQQKCLSILKEDLALLNMLHGEKYYVLHPGSSKDLDLTTALRNVANILHQIIPVIGDVHIAIEFMAGAGTQVLCTPEQVEYLMVLCYDVPNIGCCFDTCHVCGAGQSLVPTFNRLKQYISVVHLNGSAAIFGSHVDRHASIENSVGPDNLIEFYKTLPKDLPVILEVPGDYLLHDYFLLKERL